MNYVNIAKETYAWYNNLWSWIWIGVGIVGEIVLRIALYAGLFIVLGGSFLTALASGNPLSLFGAIGSALLGLIVVFLLWIVAELLFWSFVGAKVLGLALVRRGMKQREVNLGSVGKYVLFSLLQGLIVVIPVFAVILAAAVLGMLVPVLAGLLMLAGIIIAAIVYLYLAGKLICSPINYWSREGCGAIEAIQMSWKQTSGKEVGAVLGILASLVSMIVGILVLVVLVVVLMMLQCLGLILAIPVFLAIAALAINGEVFAMVEIYSQITGEGKGVKAPEAKKASAPVKKAVAKKK